MDGLGGGVGVRRVLLHIGILAVAALWIAEDMGWIHMAGADVPAVDADLPPPVAEAMGLVAQGVIVGQGKSAGMVMLSDKGRPPEMVSEGQAYHEDLRVERVLADRVVLRQRDSNAPIVLAVVAPAVPPQTGGDAAPPPVAPAGPMSTVVPPASAAPAR